MKKTSLIRPAGFLVGLAVVAIWIVSSVSTAGTTYTWNPTALAASNWDDITATGWNSGGGYPGSGGDLTLGAVENDVADTNTKAYSGGSSNSAINTANSTIHMNGVNAFLSEFNFGSTLTTPSAPFWTIDGLGATSGGSITFKALSGTATINSNFARTGRQVYIQVPVAFVSNTNVNLMPTDGLTDYFGINGAVTGAGNLTINTPATSGGGVFFVEGDVSGYTGTVNFDATGTSGTGNAGDRVGLIPSSVNAQAMSVNLSGPTNLGKVGIFSMELGALNGTGGFIHPYNDAFVATLKVGYKNNPVDSYSGVLAGSVVGTNLSFEKAGSGTQILGGANTYSGTTTVTAGKLIVNGSHTGGDVYAVNATLGGKGAIGSTVNLSASGTLAPGDSTLAGPGATAGKLTVDSLSVTTGASFAFELDPSDTTPGDNVNGNDPIAIAGALTLDGGTVNLNVQDSMTPGNFGGIGTWTLETFGSLTGFATPGTFDITSFVNVTGLAGNVTSYVINANVIGDGSGSITLTTVPEPHSMALGVMSCAGLVGYGLRKRKPKA